MALITQPTNVPSEWFELARESFYYSITKGRHTAARQPIGKNLVHDLPAKSHRSDSGGHLDSMTQSSKSLIGTREA
jgi:hypothetical protein